ncbi:glycosyltransferase [Microbacterium sp. DT81.1]|uniref:glycosyltransferase n=1 Tax=Microbacterium sp. DT81.1 TaxID=3393413 RepID=UPI003CEE61AF
MASKDKGRIAFVVTSLRDGDDDPSIAWMGWFADAGYAVTAIPLLAGPVSSSLHSSVDVTENAAVHGHKAKISALSALIGSSAFGAVVGVRTESNLVVLEAMKGHSSPPLAVVTEENPLSLFLDSESRTRRRQVRDARRAYRRADLAISASHPIAAELTAAFGVPASRSLVVPRPVLAQNREDATFAGPPEGDGPIHLVLTCELTARTDADVVVHAAKSLGDRGIRSEVLSLRGGPREAALGALADTLGVPFSIRHDVGEDDWRLPAGSVVVLPSRSEGVGADLVQATSRAVPATAISTALGVADAIIPGVTGELALDDHPLSVADAVERASKIKVTDVGGWIDRFTPRFSGALLERAVQYGHGLAER